MLIPVKLYIPDSLEEARQIIPGIDEKRFEKWRREGIVELVLEEVYVLQHNRDVMIEIDVDEARIIEGNRTVNAREYLSKICVELKPDNESYYMLAPDTCYVLVTEQVNIPRDLKPFDVNFRSTFHRFGLIGRVSNIEPGFRGRIHVLLYVPPCVRGAKIRKGARVIQVGFLKLEKALRGYRGQWQDT